MARSQLNEPLVSGTIEKASHHFAFPIANAIFCQAVYLFMLNYAAFFPLQSQSKCSRIAGPT